MAAAAASGRTRTANDSDRRLLTDPRTRNGISPYDECVEKIIEAVNGKGNARRNFSLPTLARGFNYRTNVYPDEVTRIRAKLNGETSLKYICRITIA